MHHVTDFPEVGIQGFEPTTCRTTVWSRCVLFPPPVCCGVEADECSGLFMNTRCKKNLLDLGIWEKCNLYVTESLAVSPDLGYKPAKMF